MWHEHTYTKHTKYTKHRCVRATERMCAHTLYKEIESEDTSGGRHKKRENYEKMKEGARETNRGNRGKGHVGEREDKIFKGIYESQTVKTVTNYIHSKSGEYR
jgi:hypothetical protein